MSERISRSEQMLCWIQEELKSNQKELAFAIEDADDSQVKVLAEELCKSESSRVKSLSIKGYNVGPDGAKNLGKMLETNSTLTKLEMFRGRLQNEDAMRIIEAVKQNDSIVFLRLHYVKSLGESTNLLCEMLQTNQSLRELEIIDSNMADGAATVVEVAVAEKRLTRLCLSFHNMSSNGTKRICDALRSKNRSLRSIDLSGVKFDQEATELLIGILNSDQVLEEITLRYCRFSLKLLDIRDNHLGPTACKAAAEMLTTNACLQSFILELAELSALEGCRIIFEAMTTNRSITELFIEGCSIDENDSKLVSDMVRLSSSLKYLSLLTYDTECNKVCEALARAMAEHRSLQKLEWPTMSKDTRKLCTDILMEGNGSLVDCSFLCMTAQGRQCKSCE